MDQLCEEYEVCDKMLIIAASRGDLKLCKLLLTTHDADSKCDNNKAIKQAYLHGHDHVIEFLNSRSYGICLSYDDVLGIIASKRVWEMSTLSMLLRSPTMLPYITSGKLLYSLCRSNNPTLVGAVMSHPLTDPSMDKCKALMIACEYGQLSVVKVLLEDERVDPTIDGNKAIITAAKSGHKNVTEYLKYLKCYEYLRNVFRR